MKEDSIKKFWLCTRKYDNMFVYLFVGSEPMSNIDENGGEYWLTRTVPSEEYPYNEWLGTRIPTWIMDELYRVMDIPKATLSKTESGKIEFEGDPTQLFRKIGFSYNKDTKKIEIG
jgi:hypothetical protein